MNQMNDSFEYVFPAIRGIQAKREYYVSMCPLRLLPKIFVFDEEELSPELRAQRRLNKGRLPEIASYVLKNLDSYTFSAITASVDGEMRFEPLGAEAESHKIGRLHMSMDAKFVINDGQHRRAAIELALQERPELGTETIAVVFFQDRGLARSQQMFADLNQYAIRTTRSLNVLFDQRDAVSQLVKLVVFKSPMFRDLVEMERSTLAPRSRKLFTLSALHRATDELLAARPEASMNEKADLVRSFWEEVAKQIPEWQAVHERTLAASEVRRDFLHSHGVVLHALGRVGNVLLRDGGDWRPRLAALKKVDWSRANSQLWEGRAMIGGRVSKSDSNVTLTTNAIKKALGLVLAPEEKRVEDAYRRGKNGE